MGVRLGKGQQEMNGYENRVGAGRLGVNHASQGLLGVNHASQGLLGVNHASQGLQQCAAASPTVEGSCGSVLERLRFAVSKARMLRSHASELQGRLLGDLPPQAGVAAPEKEERGAVIPQMEGLLADLMDALNGADDRLEFIWAKVGP